MISASIERDAAVTDDPSLSMMGRPQWSIEHGEVFPIVSGLLEQVDARLPAHTNQDHAIEN